MNQQEILDRVVEHAKLGVKSTRNGFGRKACAYRGDNGSKCFVGLFIPDNKYHHRLEDLGIQELFWDLGLDIGYSGRVLLTDLRSIHDCYEPTEWRIALSETARQYALQFNW